MTPYISILRGINVGGKRKILMADLKALYERIGLTNPLSYIQSGNVLFEVDDKQTPASYAQAIKDAIAEQYGFDVPVIVRSVEAWNKAIAQSPFTQNPDIDITQLHMVALAEVPDKGLVAAIKERDFGLDVFEVIDDNVYLCINGKFHQSKLSNNLFEKKLNVAATTRNWKTVLKLAELAG